MENMKISYAIPVHNEHEEIDRLLKHLLKHKKDTDEIVVQCDEGNTTGNVYKVLENSIGIANDPCWINSIHTPSLLVEGLSIIN